LSGRLVRTNALANLLGQSWGAILQLVLLPFYLKFLGIEAYALVGLYVMLITAVQVFDLGLAQTLNRELARFTAARETARQARDLVRTLEIVYWGMVIAICLALLLAAPFIARHALNAQSMSPHTLQVAISLMIVVIAMQWPTNLWCRPRSSPSFAGRQSSRSWRSHAMRMRCMPVCRKQKAARAFVSIC
jgi:O-antigen/teichoic acid export membrane protein